MAQTIEEAVAFYNSDAFNNSPAGTFGQINLSAPEVQQIAAFLRVINAVENIRSALDLAQRARSADMDEGQEILKVCIADIRDGIRVLNDVYLHGRAVKWLEQAQKQASKARKEKNQRKNGIKRLTKPLKSWQEHETR